VQAGACGFCFCLPWKEAGLKRREARLAQSAPFGVERKTCFLDLFDTVFEVIDMRSFSNLWYWIALAVLWSSTSHWVLGVPQDMIQRARREGGQMQQDVEDMVRINANRLLGFVQKGAVVIVAVAFFWLTIIGVLGFYYDLEFAQAVFLLMAPMSVVVWLSLWTSRKIVAGEAEGAALHRRLTIHRRITQAIGMTAIFVTAMYGMWQNLNVSILY
jgi:hypothetical protein